MASYTLDELITIRKPQHQQHKCIINQCLEGLILYAAQLAQKDKYSSKLDEMRITIELISDYWCFIEDNPPTTKARIQAFDDKVYDAKQGNKIDEGGYRVHADTIYGLYCHGEDLIESMGSNSMTEILDTSDLIEELAKHWNYQPYEDITYLSENLRIAVRGMLDDYALPGQAAKGENIHYMVKQGILFHNYKGFVLAHNPKAPSPFVTWRFNVVDGRCNYEMGHYFNSRERALLDYIDRVEEYTDKNKVTEIPLPTVVDIKENNCIVTDLVYDDWDSPDPTVSKMDMYAYGYGFEGMIPVSKSRAEDLFISGHNVLLLYGDDTDEFVDDIDQIKNFVGMFGIERTPRDNEPDTGELEVFILNCEQSERGTNIGEWLTLPADADALSELVKRIGIDNPNETSFKISAIRLPYDCMRDYISKNDSLDQLNMLASHLANTESHVIKTIEKILLDTKADIGMGVSAIVNLLKTENIGQMYYDRDKNSKTFKVECVPITDVPEEFRITEAAIRILQSEETHTKEKPSVINKIKEAGKVQGAVKEKEPQKTTKSKKDEPDI